MGQPRALILDGLATYKVAGTKGAQAAVLSQTLKGAPGVKIRVTGYVMGETFDRPSGSNTKLEGDHFVVSVGLGGVVDIRMYASMISRFDIPNNSRQWNRFTLENTFPASGQLDLQIILQQNWAGASDFFLDNFRVEVVP